MHWATHLPSITDLQTIGQDLLLMHGAIHIPSITAVQINRKGVLLMHGVTHIASITDVQAIGGYQTWCIHGACTQSYVFCINAVQGVIQDMVDKWSSPSLGHSRQSCNHDCLGMR